MNDVDLHIRSAVDKTVSTAPPPVPVESILSRHELAAEPVTQPERWRALILAVSAAVVVILLVAMMLSGEGRREALVDVEAVDATDTDDAEPDVLDRPVVLEFTAREGLWLSETVPQIADQLPEVEASQLWAALDASEPLPPFAPSSSDIVSLEIPGLSQSQLRWEGLLSPATYAFDADVNAVQVIKRMHDEFIGVATDLGYRQAPEAVGLSPYEVVVVASLIETADASNDGDRAKIARVIYNRLAADLPLGLDSAYLYAAQDRHLEFTPSLLETPGPYGLRQGPGLPPTPISTPSRASLSAAIDPATGPWLFYNPADNQGNYYFATTLAQHNANVAAAHEGGLLD